MHLKSIKNGDTDFTYLFLTNGSKRYNCTIIDLHDRSVIASITDKKNDGRFSKTDSKESNPIPARNQSRETAVT